ncbi:MAG TPA: fatty acyl-AMP ligase [Terrimicrobiaceae bacterium]
MSEPPRFALDVNVSTLIELLAWRAGDSPEICGFSFLHEKSETCLGRLTYRQLQTRAHCIAMALREVGVREGDRVLLLYPPGLDFVAAFFGVLCAGAAAVPAHPPHPARLRSTLPRIAAVVADAQPAAILSTAAIRTTAAEAHLFSEGVWLATDDLEESQAGEWSEPQVKRNALALVQYTSGSTASPKGVLITHHNLLQNSLLIHRAFGHSPQSRGVIWLPPYHDMGLIGGVIQPLFGGFPVTLMSPASFLMRPLSWLKAIADESATTSGGPNFAFDLCVRKTTPEQRAELDLRSWEVAFVGAEPVRPETLQRFAEAFAPSGFRPEALLPCYGLAESTLFVTGGVKGERSVLGSGAATAIRDAPGVQAESVASRELVGCGKAMPGAKVLIVDPERCIRCEAAEVGEVWIASDSVAQGYHNRLEESERTFDARLADTGEGPFLRTGDLGFLRNGELFLTGRLKNVIIIGGRNHCAEDIERTVENCHPTLRPGCCAAFSVDLQGEERLVIAAEVERRPPASPAESHGVRGLVETIRRAVAELHDVRAHAVVMLRPASLPKTSSGKTQRHMCRAGFLASALNLIEEN